MSSQRGVKAPEQDPNINPTDDQSLADDMLEGAEKIGSFMGLKPRQVYHLQDRLPVFTIGAKLFSRKSTILKWVADREAKDTGTPR